ncbi:hypothetical protein K1T71_011143 [Dendrolimus kikuchii]|uniref:Uncharacterized protein n=1 Tax=Dendrolimus kikuchii TaxID=765133 RepID=A0ACC1CN07_9NEOP|nr:hypothetical protein K1T71_011143 [Dendrolimus kikuchii]
MASTPQEHVNECESSLGGERVVISGISGLYPSARNVQELSNILYEKKNPINDENVRWSFNHPELCNKTGKVPDLSYFDAQFFKVHWRQGNNMDLMSRKILEQTFQAIYDAGLSPDQLFGKKVGVYVGSCFSESEKTCFYVAISRTGFGISGCNKSMFANRISYWLNAKGPSMAIDQSCCSSLAALQQAYLAIKKGECEAAIVGGCHLSLHPQSSVHLARIVKLSSDGKTKSFDQNADGCAKSEAVNVLFLQKAKDALRIYAEVVHVKSEFTSVLEGELGPKYGFYRDPIKVANFLKEFYKEAGIPPQMVEYVEAYGSAAPEVDKVELEVLDEVFCSNRTGSLPVGSVMSNIGYAEAASGISAITKVLLGYHRGELAGNLHLTTPRQDISALQEGKIRILDDHQRFQRTYAAVNAMSVTGVNAHVLLSGHYKPKDLHNYKSSIPYLVTASGRHEAAVTRIFDDLKSRPIDAEELALLHKIHEIRISGHMGRGFAILDTKGSETVSLCEKTGYFDDMRRPLWFVYSGMGSQWPGMGTQLMRIPIFAAAIERCQKALEPKGIDLVNILTSTDKTIFNNILHSFVGIAAVQIGLTDILKELGIVPDNIIGHSVGELGCAYADGCLTTEEMILSAYSRGLVSLQTPFIRGSMAAVGMGYAQIRNLCPATIEVACHNGPESCTISGPADAMREFVAHLTAKGVFAREVPCSNIAYHSRYIAEAGPGLLKYLKEVIKRPRLRSERWVSTSVPQNRWHEQAAQYSSAEYHTNNLLSSVLFEETSRLIPPNAVLVEIAPHGLLQAILKRSLSESCRHIPLTRRGHPDNAYLLLQAVGKMFMEGLTPKIYGLYPKVEFPVSTGTPMLSHLIEWDHRELWFIPLYASANRRVAASCNYMISLHDDEHTYLRGHVVRNKILYPFGGALVAAWDTLAMTLGLPKKQVSVKFEDVHFYSQPILHNQKRLKLTVQLHRGSGYFEITDADSKVASGYIKNSSLKLHKDEIHFSNVEMSNNKLAKSDIYDLLRLRDYNYSGDFCSIYSADASLFEAAVEWNNNWVTLIDGLLQLHVLHRPHDSVSQLSRITGMSIDVNQHSHEEKLSIDGRTMMSAVVSKDLHYIRCGGLLVQQIVFTDLLSKTDEDLQLEDLSISHFIPNIRSECNSNLASYNGQTLCSASYGDFNALKWVHNKNLTGDGVDVKVHYAGINDVDVKVAAGIYPVTKQFESGYGMDFSGVTKCGQRVMGLVREGAASSCVRTPASLLWPVPNHWTLEEAATVPLAYLQALFCLSSTLTDKFGGFDNDHGRSVLIQGGAGALGQAAISVALAFDYEVFTSVSSVSKKEFLKKLFPQLKDDHIGYSRDNSFSHMVLNKTNGKGCTVVILCLKGSLKNVSLKCCAPCGVAFDLVQVPSREIYSLPMGLLTEERSYLAVDVASLLDDPNSKLMKSLHSIISEGIGSGYVRPLSRICFSPAEVARAFRLVATSNHRGRVLIKLEEPQPLERLRLCCSELGCHILVCNKDLIGIQLAERLLSRGARKLRLIYNEVPVYIQNKKRSWEMCDIQVEVSSHDILSMDCANNIFNEVGDTRSVEGVYVIATDANKTNAKEYNILFNNFDLISRKSCPNLKHFAIVCSTNDVGHQTYLSRDKNQLPVTLVCLPASNIIAARNEGGDLSSKKAVDVIEKAILSKSSAVIAKCYTKPRLPILESLASRTEYEDVKGLTAFYSLVDSDELIATTELILLPTLANGVTERQDEFDVKQKYMYIIPGLEGHHERFRSTCERLKIPALVLQPGLDRPWETIQELAQRYAKVILEKTDVKNDFYLLGYENGVAVALEIAAILENSGYTGTIFCVGFLPDEFKFIIEEQLKEYETEEQLQDAVLRHMYGLMTKGNPGVVEQALGNASDWGEKVEACVRALLGHVSHSAQYARSLIEAAYGRILRAREYRAQLPPLQSRLVLLRAATSAAPRTPAEPLALYSLQPLLQHQLAAPLAQVLCDLRCASIINRYLAPAILEEFEKKNLCETYLLDSDAFLSSGVNE